MTSFSFRRPFFFPTNTSILPPSSENQRGCFYPYHIGGLAFENALKRVLGMCVRAAQTRTALQQAAHSLGHVSTNDKQTHHQSNAGSEERATQTNNNLPSRGNQADTTDGHSGIDGGLWADNFNMSPGMDATVFILNKDDPSRLEMSRKSWGLIMKGGTSSNPLPPQGTKRMGIQFSNLMYNARSDTLYQKPTFSRLASQGRACLIVFDGYFEWMGPSMKGQKKQPYFMYRKKISSKNEDSKNSSSSSSSSPYLLLAGLWNRVATGIPDEPTVDTFTMLTTEAHSQIRWLHHRMPLSIWDFSLARSWLENPTSEKLLRKLRHEASIQADCFDWHMVSPDMSSVSFRDERAVKAVPKPRSVASFFQPKQENGKNAEGKRPLSALSSNNAMKKRKRMPRKGTITSFFSTESGEM